MYVPSASQAMLNWGCFLSPSSTVAGRSAVGVSRADFPGCSSSFGGGCLCVLELRPDRVEAARLRGVGWPEKWGRQQWSL
mmetsp:Transcript_61042/g.133625  ORF Transcript_61042/g.133625 Transcript_61042/m.133625 type:complete len:80 (+) Transcript_61042:1386-1625(+)